jgi:hypothetical protein
MTEKNLMKIVFVPIIGIIFQLFALVSIAMIAKNIMMGELSVSGKVTIILSLFATLLSLFLYFTENGWPYAVIVAVASGITAASLASDSFSLHLFTVFINLFVILYLLGPVSTNSFFGLGSGLWSTLPTGPPQSAQAQCYGTHFVRYSGFGEDVLSNPSVFGWGYCSRGYLSFLLFVALMLDALVAFVAVAHAFAVFTPPAASYNAV